MSVIWITGLSDSGKTTLGNAFCKHIRSTGRPVVMLDGNDLREVLAPVELGSERYDLNSRKILALRYARLSKLISDNGVMAVVTTISLFNQVHDWNRANIHNYFEIFLDVPLEELKRRDSKGIYKKFFEGELKNVWGLDLAVQLPRTPDLTLNSLGKESVEQLLSTLIESIKKKGI